MILHRTSDTPAIRRARDPTISSACAPCWPCRRALLDRGPWRAATVRNDEWVMSAGCPTTSAPDDSSADGRGRRVARRAHRTLGQLARKRGWSSQRKLARALVAPRLNDVRPAMRPVLERRALETLTQGHSPTTSSSTSSARRPSPTTRRRSSACARRPSAACATAACRRRDRRRDGRTRAGARRASRHLQLGPRRARGEARGDEPGAGEGALRRADGEPRGVHGPHLPHAVAAGQLPLPPALSPACRVALAVLRRRGPSRARECRLRVPQAQQLDTRARDERQRAR